jgi:hypothetical protein
MDQQSFAVQAGVAGSHTHTRQNLVAGMFAVVQEAAVLVVAVVGRSPEGCILVALTVDAEVDYIGFARTVVGLGEVRLSGAHTGFGRIGSALEVEMWLEGKRWDCRFPEIAEAGVWASVHKDQVVIVIVGNRNFRCERKLDGLIADVLTREVASLGLGIARRSSWKGIV